MTLLSHVPASLHVSDRFAHGLNIGCKARVRGNLPVGSAIIKRVGRHGQPGRQRHDYRHLAASVQQPRHLVAYLCGRTKLASHRMSVGLESHSAAESIPQRISARFKLVGCVNLLVSRPGSPTSSAFGICLGNFQSSSPCGFQGYVGLASKGFQKIFVATCHDHVSLPVVEAQVWQYQ